MTQEATKDGRATLATVAAAAGVSVATVSKVLNGRSDVAPATRGLVQDLLVQHDYVGRGADTVRRASRKEAAMTDPSTCALADAVRRAVSLNDCPWP